MCSHRCCCSVHFDCEQCARERRARTVEHRRFEFMRVLHNTNTNQQDGKCKCKCQNKSRTAAAAVEHTFNRCDIDVLVAAGATACTGLQCTIYDRRCHDSCFTIVYMGRFWRCSGSYSRFYTVRSSFTASSPRVSRHAKCLFGCFSLLW